MRKGSEPRPTTSTNSNCAVVQAIEQMAIRQLGVRRLSRFTERTFVVDCRSETTV